MERKIIYENHRDSMYQIREVEKSIPDFQSLIDNYAELFETAPTMDDLKTMFNEPDLTRQRFFEAITKDLPRAQQKAVISTNEPDIAGLLAKAKELEPVLQHLHFLTLTKDKLSFTEHGRESVKEQYRIYINSETGHRLFELQQQFVEILNEYLKVSTKQAPKLTIIPFRILLDLAQYNRESEQFEPTIIDFERFVSKA